MKKSSLICIFIIMLFGLNAQADDGAKYRELLEQKSPSIVSVKIVLKLNITYMGQSQQQEQTMEVQGVIVAPSGLIMVSSSAIDPNVDGMREGLTVKFDPQSVKVMIEDEEYDAVVGVTDSNLNLSFLLLKDLKGLDLSLLAMDFAKGAVDADVKIGDELFGVSRFTEGFDYAPYFGITRISGKVEQPRPCFSIKGSFSEQGLPLYDMEGRLAGVLSVQKGSEGAEGGASARGNSGTFLIPAATLKASLPLALEKSRETLKKDAEREAKQAAEDAEEEEED